MRHTSLPLIAALVAAPFVSSSFAAETGGVFRPGELWKDDKGVHINAHGGGILFDGGVYYWFGEHKVSGDAGNYAQVGVHVYSSKNLTDWKDEGVALAVSEDPKSPIAKGCILERPKVVKNAAGKYVMWFHLERKGHGYGDAFAGVAVADKPTGPFVFHHAGRLDAGVRPLNVTEAQMKDGSMPYPKFFTRDFAKGHMSRDMSLFRDDDGAIYQITSSEENYTLHIRRLNDDATESSGKYIRIFPGASNEAPAVFKKDGKYYLFSSGCTGWAPNAARLSVADSMLGEWKSLGNPVRGTDKERKTTFGGQSTHVIPVEGMPGKFVFMGDLWRPKDAIDGRYLWLPVEFEDGIPVLHWHKEWSLKDVK